MRRSALVLGLALAGSLLRASRADACGGTFCDAGPMTMPVDQTGESILFVLDQGQVEVHIRIQYDPNTDAANFAWMIPVPAVPEFEVGSELFFRELLRATVPTYGLTTNNTCDDSGGGGGCGSFVCSPDAGGGGGWEPPPVVKVETVGAFDVVVLAGKSAPEILQWLGDNGYQQDPAAEPIIQQYLDEGNNLVAFKLATGEGLDAIHPIVLRFPGAEGCVPIRLTRIAAVDDMDLRVFALGEARAIPTNYRHVLVNPLKIDWLNFGANYKEVVSMAVDAFGADGHAFVTEYAGWSGVVDYGGFYGGYWDGDVFAGLAPTAVIDELSAQGLAACQDPQECNFYHPLVEGLLATYLPVPDGVPAADFYSCLSCFEADIDLLAWGDGSGFAEDMNTRIVDPAAHAVTLIQTWPGVTRLYTTISPAEMTEDPLFQYNPDLPGVSNLRVAARDIDCDGNVVVTLPDGRQVFLNTGDPWPQFQDEMPWEEDVDQMVMDGMPQPLVDNTPLIDELLAEWNMMHSPPSGTTGTPPTTSDSDSGTGSASASSSGPYSTESDSSPAVWGQGSDFACACRSDGGRPGLAALLALLGLAAVRPRRRR